MVKLSILKSVSFNSDIFDLSVANPSSIFLRSVCIPANCSFKLSNSLLCAVFIFEICNFNSSRSFVISVNCCFNFAISFLIPFIFVFVSIVSPMDCIMEINVFLCSTCSLCISSALFLSLVCNLCISSILLLPSVRNVPTCPVEISN